MPTVSDVRKALYEPKTRESRRSIAHPEIRETGDGSFRISGYASTTDAPYEVFDWLGTYTETIARGAFTKALKESEDVRLLVNHDGTPLARTRSGTLSLTEITDPTQDPQGRSQTGLWCEADIDGRSPLAQTIRSAMERGDLDEMSFAFSATRQEWNADYTERIVLECRLYDVSIVTYPANPATSVQLNSAEMAGIAARMQQGRALPEDQAKIAELMGVFAAIDSIADEALESVAEYLGVENPDEDEPATEESEESEIDEDESALRAQAFALAQARARN